MKKKYQICDTCDKRIDNYVTFCLFEYSRLYYYECVKCDKIRQNWEDTYKSVSIRDVYDTKKPRLNLRNLNLIKPSHLPYDDTDTRQ